MLREGERLQRQITQLRRKLKEFPEGKLISGHSRGYQQWFQSNGHQRKYIPKKNKKLVEQLAIKKYLSYLLEDCEKEKRAIEYYLKHHREDVGRAEKFLTEQSEYRELLSPYFQSKSQVLQEWLQEPYEQNSQYNENLILKTISGHTVRSKSEVIIATLLYLNRIPFRYECELKLGNRKFYPDFTIMHPKTGKIYYYEHFGKMDDPDYVKKACAKMQAYALHGIIPGIDLILTFETAEHPLGTEDVMEVLEKYFGTISNQEMVKF